MKNKVKNRHRVISRFWRMYKSPSRLFRKVCVPGIMIIYILLSSATSFGQKLQVNDLGYFKTQGVDIFVYSNQYTGMFFP
jgi:hypothetical protein